MDCTSYIASEVSLVDHLMMMDFAVGCARHTVSGSIAAGLRGRGIGQALRSQRKALVECQRTNPNPMCSPLFYSASAWRLNSAATKGSNQVSLTVNRPFHHFIVLVIRDFWKCLESSHVDVEQVPCP